MGDETVEHALARFKASLLQSFDIGGLFSRNNIAHKWKATFRSVLLREAVFWRLEDLLQQSYALHQQVFQLPDQSESWGRPSCGSCYPESDPLEP